MNTSEKITFYTENEDGTKEAAEFFVLEETTVSGNTFLLVADEAESDANAYILQKITESDDEVVYEFVEDDELFAALIKVFSELLEDTDFVEA